jgi:hypothetical protein
MKRLAPMLALALSGCVMVPPQFQSQTHGDGSRTFSYGVHLTSSHPSGADKVEQITSTYVAHFAPANFCANGWQITNQSENDGYLKVDGRCR